MSGAPGRLMPALPGSRRFFESTRGRVVERLRRGTCTVEALANELGLTDNAVRGHLATLERDGMVRAAGVRRDGGVGKPATLYELAPDAEAVMSRAYVPLVRALLGALPRRLSPRQLRSLFRDAGRHLAGDHAPATGALRTRAQLAAATLTDLGGLVAVETNGAGYRIVGHGCPLADAVSRQPEVCTAVETMLGELSGTTVRQHCEHGDRPSCRFEVTG
jgi:predicted ArsR family transcriptional regulator